MTRGVYQIKNTITGDHYIGQAGNIARRWRVHKAMLNRGTHHSQRLQRDWDDYGADVFRWEVVEEVSPTTSLTSAEARHINAGHPAYNTARVVDRPPPPILRASRVNTRAPEDCYAVATVRDHTRCMGCGLAINIETQIHPGLGQTVEIRQINPETSEWEDISTASFRDDSVAELWAGLTTLEENISDQERYTQMLEERIVNLEAEIERLRNQQNSKE